ncbi:uncharacterized protein LOC108032472 [Drosophila biarmipes]|uniref:uncharacterized protein LOC108032472 n=1 Tax=Drosophila biarmipes TaxID=125945 RepID=UPI0007E8559A|nr:uncharacterized protein LOC108032472 [Drosophila biarmipes]
MVSLTTIVITGLLHMLRISFFVAQWKGKCSPAPSIGGYIFLVAILLLFWDSDMIPRKFKKYSPRIFACGDLVLTIFFTELLLLIGWCGYERITHRTLLILCHGRTWCIYGLLTFTSILGAIASLGIVIEVVCPVQMKVSVAKVLSGLSIPQGACSVFDYIQDVRTYVMGFVWFSQLTREERLLSVRAFEMQVLRSKASQMERPDEPAGQQENQVDGGGGKPEDENQKPPEPEIVQELSP